MDLEVPLVEDRLASCLRLLFESGWRDQGLPSLAMSMAIQRSLSLLSSAPVLRYHDHLIAAVGRGNGQLRLGTPLGDILE